ncbi:MAG: cell division protein ZapA [Spirochaetales bacterium]|nr:cell division protein ZapA [Spirochaetales bacterium]
MDVLGTSFTIHADEEPEYLNTLIEYYREKVEEIQSSSRAAASAPLKTAILAGIVVADELFKLRSSSSRTEAGSDEAGRIAERLIRQLTEVCGP